MSTISAVERADRARVRIHLFGASGTGTTSLGHVLAHRLRSAMLDADDYFWQPTDPPFTHKRPVEERLALLQGDMEGVDSWVLSGSICGWGDALGSQFTVAVFLRLDPDIRMARLGAREHHRFGSRIKPGGDMHSIHQAFMTWARRYDTAGLEQRSLEVHELWMKQLNCPVLRLNASNPLDVLADQVVDGRR